ncbi:hypothetical protein ACQKMI_19235 [Lysinibacillus sp. NPDC097214]|uniref:hypothetical protein n=1 Tax=Lysinibacillus sp. NPDC097214 TaxID=3390584 RepID=UPI003D06EA3A
MIPARIEVVVDEKLVKEEIKKQVDAAVVSQLWFCDANKIAELCCLSVRFLEEHIFSDYRMRAIQIQKNRKRIWRADKAFEVIEEIFGEW